MEERETCRGLWGGDRGPGAGAIVQGCALHVTWGPGRGLASSCLSLQMSRAAPASNFPEGPLAGPSPPVLALSARIQLDGFSPAPTETRGLSAAEGAASI